MSLKIREATTADTLSILKVLNDALARKHQHQDSSWGKGEFTPQEVSELFETGTILLAEENGQIVGCVHFTESDANMWNKEGSDGKAFYVHRLSRALDTGATPTVGRILIEEVADRAKKANRPYLRLDCPAKNTALCAYYESSEFKQIRVSTDGRVAYYQRVLLGT